MASRLFGFTLIVAGLSCAAAIPARADSVSPNAMTPPMAQPSTGVADATAAATPARFATAHQALDEAGLSNCHGSGGVAVANQTLSAISSGDSTFGSYTAGAVNITSSALSNFNGFGNITINTGALSQLQSAMNITVNVNP